LEYGRTTGEQKWIQSALNLGKQVLETELTVIGCAGCTHELFDGSRVAQFNEELAGTIMQETCVSVTLMKFMMQLMSINADPSFADVIETAFYNDVLGHALEISSMGIRVDAESLDRQLTERGCDDRRALPFHSKLLSGELPLTIGGGIGQSRLCMLMMGCAHIGEVQSSIWDKETVEGCRSHGIILL
jgi:hypothetical protein